MSDATLGQAIDALAATIDARASADPKDSYTAALLAGGPQRCAQKMGEEAFETAIAATSLNEDALAHEAADLLYHLLVTLKSRGVAPADVALALSKRTSKSGHEEKAGR